MSKEGGRVPEHAEPSFRVGRAKIAALKDHGANKKKNKQYRKKTPGTKLSKGT